MRIATWNLEWAKPGTKRHARCIDHLESLNADVIVTTEHSAFDWPTFPYRVDAGPDWGYPLVEGRRKVIAWSKTPWFSIHDDWDGAARGRLIRSSTETGAGRIDLVSVCIPWRDAHVRTGRKDQGIWDEHREYLDTLADVIGGAEGRGPTIVAGDFNQRFPRTRQPVDVFEKLQNALGGLDVVTAGEFDCGRLIDHVATSSDLSVTGTTAWPNVIDGNRLTDHSGVVVDLDSRV